MHRKGYITHKIISDNNYTDAFCGFADGKMGRESVRDFLAEIDKFKDEFFEAFKSQSWRPNGYKEKEVFVPKHRWVHKAPVADNVAEWAALLPVEHWIFDTFYYRSPSCVPKKGTHYFVRQEMRELQRESQQEVYYTCQLDIHHYFYNIDHDIMKKIIRRWFKDPCLLTFLDSFIDSYDMGLVLGVKLSQTLSGMYLTPFDRIALRCFGIMDDPEKFHYWQGRYVTDKLLTCRTEEQIEELAHGVDYLNKKFEKYCREGLKHYSRFADNIVIKHQDKTFLHIMVELAVMILARDYKAGVNKSWNVRPSWMGNDLCGYMIYHDHIMLRKRNKKNLVRQVKKLQKRGLTNEQIRRKVASRVGFAYHCNSLHLLKTLNMERLGNRIKNRKRRAPFEGMTVEQKKSIEDIVCFGGEDENEHFILLLDYDLADSLIEKNEDGTPKQRIAIRYKCMKSINRDNPDNPLIEWGNEEYYSFSGSKVMIDQATNDFNRDDLPLPTVVKEFVNKQRKKFYKFT